MHREPETTADLLVAVAHGLRYAFVAALAEHDVTPAQARALRAVADLGSARLSALAEQLRIAPRSATEVVDALEHRGLVERRPDPDDRRATCVVTTDEGRRVQQVLGEARRRATEAFLAGLGRADRAELDRILRLLVEP